jgi:tripartite-type tricarboxylate transporter receptor subunit TctC
MKPIIEHGRVTLCVGAALLAGTAGAQTFPSKPIRVVVPWTPGGVTDVLTRALATEIGESVGHPVTVENRTGAGGTIGIAQVAKSPPDGYTLVMTDVPSHAISATLYAKLPYDVIADLEPIGLMAGSPMVLAANAALGVKTLPELLKLLRDKPGHYSFASSGNGSITHLALERLKRDAKVDMVHVPYKGTVPAIASVLAGDSIVAFGTIPGVIPHAKAGKLNLIGVSFGKRFAQIADVPAIAETLPGFDIGFYTGFFAPAKTPKDVIDRLHAEMMKALAQPKMKQVLEASAAEPGMMSPARFREYLASEVKLWGDVVRAVGLKID